MPAQTQQLTRMLAHEAANLLACVHCGLCLEACPTYVKTGDENDGPRGRIYLMRAVAEGRLAADAQTFARHINRCLGCRACESACPAGVQYGQLLEAARADLSKEQSERGAAHYLLRFVLRHIWLHPTRLRLAFTVARLLRATGLARLLRATQWPRLVAPRLDFALALLDGSKATRLAAPPPPPAPPTAHAATDTHTTRALLFAGCVTEGLFARVNRATAEVLAVNGCAAERPAAQVCCGALHAHAGDLAGARQLARRNVEAFDVADAPIVTNAGGCGAMLAAYAHLLADDPQYAARAEAFSARVRDISQQLRALGLKPAPAPATDEVTTYDASCHLLHGQRATSEPLEMLHAIPGLKFVPLTGSDVCCGGAGVYNLVEPELAQRVLDEKLTHIAATGASLLATGNPGCHMQLSAGARLRGLRLRVCHPVELLAAAYKNDQDR